jgi:hypothetical protein
LVAISLSFPFLSKAKKIFSSIHIELSRNSEFLRRYASSSCSSNDDGHTIYGERYGDDSVQSDATSFITRKTK